MDWLRKSLVNKVTASLLLVMTLVFIVLGYLNYSQSKALLSKEIEEKIQIQSNALATEIDNYFKQKSIEVKQMATNQSIIDYFRTIESRDEALTNIYYQDVLASLDAMVYMDPRLGLAWVSSEKGNFLIGNGGLLTKPEWDKDTRSWHKFALESDEPVFSDPFVSAATGKNIINIVSKVMDGNEVIGFVAVDMLMDDFPHIMESYKLGNSGYTILAGKQGTIMYHPNHELILEAKIQDMDGDLGTIGQKMMAGMSAVEVIFDNNQDKYIGYSTVPTTEWTVAAVLPLKEAQAVFVDFNRITLMTNIVAVLFIVVLISIVLRFLLKDLSKTFEFSQKITQGDLTMRLELNRKDELGQLATSLNSMLESFSIIIADIYKTAQQVNSDSDILSATSNQSATTAEEVSMTINEIANGATDQAQSTSEGAEKLVQLGLVIEESKDHADALNDSTTRVSELVNDGLNTINTLLLKTRESSESAKSVNESIQKTNDSANKIGDASNLIATIADQTNLLALNAAIEAARAGEHGKGFAVVADEIRKLAEQSTESTKVIDEMVQTLKRDAAMAVDKMKQAAETVDEQVRNVEQTEENFNEISTAMKVAEEALATLIDSSVRMENRKNEVQNAIENLSAGAEENAASTEEASAAMDEQTASIEEISKSSGRLFTIALELQSVVEKFKV